jgi:hypothetical protein
MNCYVTSEEGEGENDLSIQFQPQSTLWDERAN